MRWKTAIVVLFTLVAFPPTPAAATGRSLEASIPRNGATTLSIDTAVGDVTITASGEENISVTVQLTPRKAGIFSSLKKAKEQVEAANLGVTRRGHTIRLEIEGYSGEARFEAAWRVQAPADLGLEIDMGVGDLKVDGARGPLDADLGVGDTSIHVEGGTLKIDVGVGDVEVEAPAAAYATIECSTGVGEVGLRTSGNVLRGEGMISKDLTWKGPGSDSMELETGVGDIDLDLSGPHDGRAGQD